MSCIYKIKEGRKSFTSTEKRIADYILNYRLETVEASVQDLAERTNTSAAAWIRFSKKLGYNGFSELKMSLAQSKRAPEEKIDFIIDENDDIVTLADKCCRLNMNTVLKTYQLIDTNQLDNAIKKLIAANTIYLFGVGGSAIVAQDVEQKLTRIGKKVIYNKDLHVQLTFSESMNKEDAALFISYSGTTKGLVVIAQFKPNPLSKLSDIILQVPNEEKEIRMGAISSRISSLVMTDLLYYGVFKNDLTGNKDKLIETKRIVSKI